MAGIEQSLTERISVAFGERLPIAELSLLENWFAIDSIAHELTETICDPVEIMTFHAPNRWKYTWDNVQLSSSAGDTIRRFSQRLVLQTDFGVIESYTYFPAEQKPARRVQYFEGRCPPGAHLAHEDNGMVKMCSQLAILKHLVKMDVGEHLTVNLKKPGTR